MPAIRPFCYCNTLTHHNTAIHHEFSDALALVVDADSNVKTK